MNYPRQAKRWLPTYSKAWRRIRAGVLAREPLCRECKGKGILEPATVVDHIDGKCETPHDYRPDNLQPLCGPCHSAKTATENGSFGNPKGGKRKGCTADGMPLDANHLWHRSKATT